MSFPRMQSAALSTQSEEGDTTASFLHSRPPRRSPELRGYPDEGSLEFDPSSRDSVSNFCFYEQYCYAMVGFYAPPLHSLYRKRTKQFHVFDRRH